MTQGYFASAWSDIRSTHNWFGKTCLLALVCLIPVFGPIVMNGYLLGWARDIAWGVRRPMPKNLFGNEDGNLYTRGFYALVIGVVFGLVPWLVYTIGNMPYWMALISGAATHSAVPSGQAPTSVVVDVVVVLVSVALWFFQVTGLMRMSVYGRLSAGFQLKAIWKMIRHDSKGLWRILGMGVLAAIVSALIVGVALVVALLLLFLLLGGTSWMSLVVSAPSASSAQANALLAAAPSIVFLVVLAVLLYVYAISLVEVFVNALMTRALGYWTMQFDVPMWRGQNDPMPFEQATAAQTPAQPVAAPAQPQQPAPGQPPAAEQAQTQSQQPAQPAAPAQPSTGQQPAAQSPSGQQQPVPTQQNAGKSVSGSTSTSSSSRTAADSEPPSDAPKE